MKSEDDLDSDDDTCDDSSNHLVTFSVKVLRSLVEEPTTTGGDSNTKLIDNPHTRDISRHLYELIWQAVRDKV